MHYLLQAPRKTTAFTTSDSSVARFLRRRHNWICVKTERGTLPESVSTSCIRELDNGNIEIDDEVANGHDLAEGIRDLLRRDGFVAPDLRFVGRYVRCRRLPQTEGTIPEDEATGSEEVEIWSDDGLDEIRESSL